MALEDWDKSAQVNHFYGALWRLTNVTMIE